MVLRRKTADMLRAAGLSRTARHFPLALFVFAFLGGSAWFAHHLLTSLDFLELMYLYVDDAFYYFQVARNLAAGQFSTFDGGITISNGYHPAWMFLLTPLYWIFDPVEALAAIKAFEIGLLAGGIVLVIVAARVLRLPWALLTILPVLLAPHRGLACGMEAALGLFSLGLLFAGLSGYARQPERWKWPLAGIAFVLPWVRLEYVAVSVATTTALCGLELLRECGDKPGHVAWRERVRSLTSLTAFGPVAASVGSLLLYFVYNAVVFGGIVPVSGVAKRMWTQYQWDRDGGYSFARSFQYMLQHGAFDAELLAAVEVGGYLLVIGWLWRRGRSQSDWFATVFMVGTFGLAAGHLAEFCYSVLNRRPDILALWSWYFVPGHLLMALMIPLRCIVAIRLIQRFLSPNLFRLSRFAVPVLIVVCLVLVIAASPVEFGMVVAEYESKINPLSIIEKTIQENEDDDLDGEFNFPQRVYAETQIMNKLLPEGSVVGSWCAGARGYFSRFPVVQLEGLLGSYEFLNDLKVNGLLEQPRRNHSGVASKYGVTHIADSCLMNRPEIYLKDGSRLLFEGPKRVKASYKIISLGPDNESPKIEGSLFDFWEIMEGNWDYHSGCTWVILEERIVLAFAKDCSTEDIEETRLVFSGGEAGEGTVSVVWQPWQNVEKNRLGWWVASHLLPKGAGDSIRIESLHATP